MNSTTDENSSSNSSNEDLYYNYYCCDPADLHYSYSDDSKASTAVNHGTVLDSSRVVRDVDVEEYVQHVCGISQADLAYINPKEWELEGLSAYTEQLDTGEKQDVLCEPFKNIVGNLFKTLVKDGRKLDIHYVSLGTKGREGGNPDRSFFFGSHVDKMPITWSLSKAFVEFVMTPKSQRLREFEVSRQTGALGEEGTATAGSALDAPIPDLLASPASTSSGTKRRHNSESYEPAPSAKRPRLGPLAGTAVEAPHAARYARELMALTCRRWPRVWSSSTRNFDKKPWKLALFALAIGLVQAGFEPLVASDVDAPLSQPRSSLKHAVLKLPEVNIGEGGQGGVEYAGDIGLGVWSHSEVTGDPLYVYGGLAGR